MTMPARALALTIAALVTLAGTTAAAAQTSGSRDLTTRAKRHVADGLAAQDAGDLAEAIAQYERAYRLVPHPELLFNLGQAHRLDGEPARALAFYRRYLAIEPDGRVAADARRWIAELEPIVGDAPEPDDALPGARAEPQAERTSPPPNPGRPYLYAGVSCVGLGILSTALATLAGLEARQVDRALSRHDGPWTDALLAEQDRGRGLETRSILFAGAGAALVAGGAALIYVSHHKDRNRPRPPAWAVSPLLGDRATGLVLTGELP
jgi:tetratricopeptide (TPR) repeat protein